MRRCTAFLLLAAAACSSDALAPEALDGPEPAFGLLEYGCPDPFILVFSGGHEADRNADGYMCVLKFDDGNGGYHHIEIDNDIPANQIGSCPGAFVAFYVKPGTDPVDRNGNGVLCVLTHTNKSTTIIDDNHKG